MKQQILYFTKDIPESKFFLCNIKKYGKPTKSEKEMVFIDPSVYDLKHGNEFLNIDLLHKIIPNLKCNEYISIDYPTDMNLQYSQLFIEKTYENNLKYKDEISYINTLQHQFMNIDSFIYEMERYRNWDIDFSKKIMGIGNLCRIFKIGNKDNPKHKFLLDVYNALQYYIDEYNIRWIHLYGIGIEAFQIFAKLDVDILSVDSTKWTRRVNRALFHKFGVACRKSNYMHFFSDYMYRCSEIARNNGKWFEW